MALFSKNKKEKLTVEESPKEGASFDEILAPSAVNVGTSPPSRHCNYFKKIKR